MCVSANSNRDGPDRRAGVSLSADPAAEKTSRNPRPRRAIIVKTSGSSVSRTPAAPDPWWRIPHVRLFPQRCLTAALALIVAGFAMPRASLAQEDRATPGPEEMKKYVEEIPGTGQKFEMVPIPGGTF